MSCHECHRTDLSWMARAESTYNAVFVNEKSFAIKSKFRTFWAVGFNQNYSGHNCERIELQQIDAFLLVWSLIYDALKECSHLKHCQFLSGNVA